MNVKIGFYQAMSGYYYVDPNQAFTKEEAIFITKAINKALKELNQNQNDKKVNK